METVEAVYEGGVLKPLKKVNLREGERVTVVIKRDVLKLAGSVKRAITMEELEEAYHEYVLHRGKGLS
ncbi:antitoxin [Thermococcus guaymasensis DSM 11113]|uniref:Antitoxin n=1 Tax=Thermococcus guaymasensis DSM 11113 TaxID=1432656 RepID=A0A0X1KIR4_9EURY|nr:antitoxin family protein [Thermococcus guaymasensis]AJC71145.1 antitoxin [Thermococcus guaymasensis DSM 11113]